MILVKLLAPLEEGLDVSVVVIPGGGLTREVLEGLCQRGDGLCVGLAIQEVRVEGWRGGWDGMHTQCIHVCTRHTTDPFSTLLAKVSNQNRRQVNQGRGILGPLVKQLTVYYIGSQFDMQIPSIGASLSEPHINGLSGAGCYGVSYVRRSYVNFGLRGSGDQI